MLMLLVIGEYTVWQCYTCGEAPANARFLLQLITP